MESLLAADIKFNCDISDAKFWGYFSVCGLLMRYRDLFRSERGLKPWSDIDREAIAAWISRKEGQWPELEQQEFRHLTIGGKRFHPFDAEGINEAIRPARLVYGAGYGMYMKPTFFLADLISVGTISGLAVHRAGGERVRDLLTAPAMLQEKNVFLRREPLSVLLLYKFSEMSSKQNPVLVDAFTSFGFSHRQIMDETFGNRLDALADRCAETLLLHEIAEFRESVPGWKDLLADAGDRVNEHYLRALKDLIADTSDHGPLRKIVEMRDRGALGISIALPEGFHRLLFPELRQAYDKLCIGGDWGVVEKTRQDGYVRFVAERERIMQLYQTCGNRDFGARLKQFLPV